MNKKADALLVVILIIIILLVIIFSRALRECSSDDDCPAGSYCGSDFKCHEIPVKVEYKNAFLVPSLTIGLAIIIAAIIMSPDIRKSISGLAKGKRRLRKK